MVQKDLLAKVKNVAEKLELRQAVIVQFLDLISSKHKYTSKDLVRKLGLPQVHLYRLVHEFTDLLAPKDVYIRVKRQMVDEVVGCVREFSETKRIDKNALKEVVRKYQKLRPKPIRNLDQFNATSYTNLRRIIKLNKSDDLLDKKIAFLGVDLTAITASATKKPKKVVLFEIDSRITNFVQLFSSENCLAIEAINQDLRHPVNKQYNGSFDVVFCDPPFTKDGVNIFLNQAIGLIKGNLLGRIYLCYGNSDRAREREVEIQKLILDHNLIIKTKLNKFNKYNGAESIGSQSSLYVLDWTPRTKIVKIDYKKIYTNS